MSHHFNVLVFGDLTGDFDAGLRLLLSYKDNALLVAFFEQAAHALRAEIGFLPAAERAQFVRFTTLSEILFKLKNAPSIHPALEKALTCIHQLGCFIKYYSGSRKSYPDASNTRLVGLCTGLLTGAAISCCQSLSDLIPIAVHTVLVAFRAGLCVSDVRDRVEPLSGSPEPWSVMVPGLTGEVTQEILEQFCSEKGLPAASKLYVSAYANNGVTISGPPSNLAELLSSKRLPRSTALKLRIHAPFHAAHLYPSADLDKILLPTVNSSFALYENIIPIASSLLENTLKQDFVALLRSALIQILLEPLRIDKMSDDTAEDVILSGATSVTIQPVVTSASQTFATALKKVGVHDVKIDNSMKELSTVELQLPQGSGRLGHSKLAIVGYSGRYPDAKDNDEFWQLLHEGRDVASETPKTRWDIKTHVDPTMKKKNTSATPYGCWLKDPGLFDANFFGMSPREAPQVDPAQRLAVMTAYEAMESAGMVPDSTPSTQRDRVGVFYGTTSNDWGETNSSQDVDTYYIPGSCRAFIPGRQNFFFKFTGPSYSVDTACSSSLAAMHLACNALWRGDIDTAVCGGTNVMTNPDITAGLDRGFFLSHTGNCKTFDDDADGYCRGEGVVSMIVKRFEDALADNDPVLAVILGAYTNHSAEAESITRPHVGAQKAIFERVLTSSAIDPSSISYVEMHGTGTQAGDAREMESVLSTFTPGASRRDQSLHLGSAKANVGHGESVSGVIALTKVLMMLEKNEIPPHCGIKTKINSKFPKDLTERNIHIASEPTAWERKEGKPRRAFVNNFSAAGGNSSVLVEDAPLITKSEQDPRSSHMVAVSAKSATAFEANIEAMLSYIEKSTPSLPSLAYTSTARRTHHRHRVLAHGSTLQEVSTQLRKALEAKQKPKPGVKQPVAFAFTGQGAQYPGMFSELLQFSSFRKDLERFDAIAQNQGFKSILPFVTQSDDDVADFEPLVVQLATTCCQMAMGRLWRAWGVEPSSVVGHSLGEYAALNVAGVLSDVDTIYLTGKRAQLLQEMCTPNTHSMLAVGTSVAELRNLLQGLDYEVACINAPNETVLSGTNAVVDNAVELLPGTKLRTTRLKVPFAFHSSQVDPILKEFENAARSIKFHKPQVPVLSPLLGKVITSAGAFSPTYLSRHCREAVNFCGALSEAKASTLSERTIWIEVGPHPVVVGLVKSNLGPTVVLPTLQRKKDPWKVLAGSLATLYEAGADIRWAECHRDFASSLKVLRLPAYRWDLKNYWMQYVNDWSLYKGDAAFLSGPQQKSVQTTCVHRLVSETADGNKVGVVGEVDLLREDVDPFVRGHRVNGVALCTPSVYAEMALVLGHHLRNKRPELADCLVDVQHMDVQKPLAVKSKGKGPQYLRCRVALDLTDGIAAVDFVSVTPEGKVLVKHAECSVIFPKASETLEEVHKTAPEILRRMTELRKSVEWNDRVQKMKGSSGYLLVSSLASYDAEYKGVTEVVLDSQNLEAVAKVKLNNASTKGTYQVNPYIIDNFGQPALFIMNANDEADLEKEVFVNHGWKSLQFYKEVSVDKEYRSHVKMTGPGADGMYAGDMTVFEGDEIVARYQGVKAQGVPRRLMDYIVRMRDDTREGLPGPTNNLTVTSNVTVPAAGADVNIYVTAPSGETPSSWPAALTIISEESGIPVAELSGDKAFADLGLDSLLALLCASRFREELGMAYESTIFEECPTVKDLQTFWEKGGVGAAGPHTTVSGNDAILRSMFHDDGDALSGATTPSIDDISNPISSATSVTSAESMIEDGIKPGSLEFTATSLLLQGNPASPAVTKTLFLLPDGSGSASSYASLPFVDKSLAIVALNCPFMKDPGAYPVGVDSAAVRYVTEIQRRQPRGPYALGGWSVGGIFAYRCAQLLAEQGETVSDIVLLDCPVPRGLDHLPKRYFDYCDQIGLLGMVHATTGTRRAPPPWLIPHFEACIDSLHGYHAAPFPTAGNAMPTTHVIWASEAIDAHVEPKYQRQSNDPEGLKFLVDERKDFGPNGWEALLPMQHMRFERVRDANHFSMMKGEKAVELSLIIKKALL